jgi:transposase
MPKAYDYDLRRKVLEAIELNGMKRSEASEVFGISRNTMSRALKRINFTRKKTMATENGMSRNRLSSWHS